MELLAGLILDRVGDFLEREQVIALDGPQQVEGLPDQLPQFAFFHLTSPALQQHQALQAAFRREHRAWLTRSIDQLQEFYEWL